MAVLVCTFEEIGGCAEFNGYSLELARALIINKCLDYLNCITDHCIDFNKSTVDYACRTVVFFINPA